LYGTGRLDDEENSFYSPELIWRARAKAAGMIPKAVWVAKMAWLPKNGLGPSKLGMPSAAPPAVRITMYRRNTMYRRITLSDWGPLSD
jgi:hypothetical protein